MCLVALTLAVNSLPHRSLATTVRPELVSATSIRVTTGPAYTDTAGKTWRTTSGFSASNIYSVSHAIAGTPDQPLYQTERWGNSFNYRAAVTNGNYKVTLKFAELYWSARGNRVFNVAINNVPVLTNFDILTQTAPFAALDKSFL